MKKQNKERFLLLRFGGIGDNMFITPVARELHRRGYEVDVVTRKETAAIFENNPNISKVIVAHRFGPQTQYANGHPLNLVMLGDEGAWIPERYLYREYIPQTPKPWRPYNVANYFASIEACTMHPDLCRTQMSTYTNVYDNAFGWAGIDPASMTDEQKRPEIVLTYEEKAWAHRTIGLLDKKPVMLQTFSSSPAKSYSPSKIIQNLVERGEHIIAWDPAKSQWVLDGLEVKWPEGLNTIRCSAALVAKCKFVVAADTYITHAAEAFGVKHLSFYTITPAWTISGHYQDEITVDSCALLDGENCKCYQITRDCPRKSIEAMQKLTKKETELLAMVLPDHPLRKQIKLPDYRQPEGCDGDVLTHFNITSPQGLNEMVDAAVRRYNTLLQETAYCLASINLEAEMEKHWGELTGEVSE